jgi:hypothetical protein
MSIRINFLQASSVIRSATETQLVFTDFMFYPSVIQYMYRQVSGLMIRFLPYKIFHNLFHVSIVLQRCCRLEVFFLQPMDLTWPSGLCYVANGHISILCVRACVRSCVRTRARTANPDGCAV